MSWLLLFAWSSSHAAPSPAACQGWANKMKAGADSAMAGLQHLEDPRIQGLSGTITPGTLLASVEGGVCQVQSVGTVGLQATLALQTPGGRALTCPVSVRNALVPLNIRIGGTDGAPQVLSSTLPVEALGPFMTTCIKAKWVKGAVIGISSRWIEDRKAGWHDELERWLVATP